MDTIINNHGDDEVVPIVMPSEGPLLDPLLPEGSHGLEEQAGYLRGPLLVEDQQQQEGDDANLPHEHRVRYQVWFFSWLCWLIFVMITLLMFLLPILPYWDIDLVSIVSYIVLLSYVTLHFALPVWFDLKYGLRGSASRNMIRQLESFVYKCLGVAGLAMQIIFYIIDSPAFFGEDEAFGLMVGFLLCLFLFHVIRYKCL